MVTVDTTTSGDVMARDRSLWRAAKAINAMCVRQGRIGWARDLGDPNESKSFHFLLMSREHWHGLLCGL